MIEANTSAHIICKPAQLNINRVLKYKILRSDKHDLRLYSRNFPSYIEQREKIKVRS